MKILSLHCDSISFKPMKKAIKNAEEAIEEKEQTIKECLVILTAVEKEDEANPDMIVDKLIENIKDIASQVKTNNIVVYPYAHLSPNLSSPSIAEKVLKDTETKLKKDKFSVTRAPFGWYKAFDIKCKGHPLSELSRSISLQPGEEKKERGKIKQVVVEEKYDPKQLLRQISKTRLDTEKLKDNDHRILGQRLDLFSFNETAPGMVFFHNNGLVIYNELINFLREEHAKAGYQEISTPFILDKKLWQISGHWEKYRENIFLTEYEGRDFAVKPMSCPGGMLVFKSKPRSYKDLPLRVAEFGVVHRQELSGVLAGLFRVIKFTQDDAHIYCTEDEKQLENEIMDVVHLIEKFYKKFKLEYSVELSTRPEKRIGAEEVWDKAERILENVLKKNKMEYKLNKGDGAFYGPKIDFHIKDSLGRSWQCGTIQLDFAMPERFELEYAGEDNKKHRPVMLHRVVYGAVERFMGVLLEHTSGNLPVWLSPIQARVISFTDRNIKSTEQLLKKLKDVGIRADLDIDEKTVNNRIREAELQKIPYILVMGDKEEENNTVAVRKRGEKPQFGIKAESLISELLEKIKTRE